MVTSFYQFRVPSLPKRNQHSTSKPPPLHHNTIISSKHDRTTCEFKGGQHKSLTPNPSANDDARGQQDDKEAEIANKKEGFSGDSKRDALPYLHPTKKRSLVELERSLGRNVVPSATSSHHDYIQMPKRGRATSQTSAAIHLPNPTTSPNLDPLLPI